MSEGKTKMLFSVIDLTDSRLFIIIATIFDYICLCVYIYGCLYV